jgi:hypothetical protein
MVETGEINVDVDGISRDDLLKITVNAIQKVQHKAINGRFKDDKKEAVRIQYWKTLNGLIKTSAALMMDRDLELLSDEIESLKLIASAADVESVNVSTLENKIDEINEIDERLNELKKSKKRHD